MTETHSNPGRGSRYPRATQTIAVCLVLVLAVVVRLPYLTQVGHVDLTQFIIPWMVNSSESGLFAAYAVNPSLNYPPLFPAVMTSLVTLWLHQGLPLDVTPGAPLIALFKIVPILADLGLIVVVYHEFRSRPRLQWIVVVLLALHPAVIVTSAFWGQIEPIWTLGVVLAAFCFRRNKPLAGWLCLAAAVLVKIQPVVAIPVFVVLTYRRYGLRTLSVCLALFVLVVGIVLAPFVLVSGFAEAMRSYLNAVDMFPQTTLNAFNLWYLVNPAVWSTHYPLNVPAQSDAQLEWGLFTARTVGLAMLGLWALVVLANIWRKFRAPNEYIWLTAIYFGFFMLPTQIHERYLYPVLVTSLLAIAQDVRMWGVVLPLLWSYTYNLVAFTHAPFTYLGVNALFRLGDVGIHAAAVQALAFISSAVAMVSPRESRRAWRALIPVWVVTVMIIGFTTLNRLIADPLPVKALPVNAVFEENTRLEGFDVQCADGGLVVRLYWRAIRHNNTDYAIFVHALREGARIAQDDGRPADGEYPVWRWFADQVIVTTHVLSPNISSAVPDELQVGLYDPATMDRAEVIQDGSPAVGQAVSIALDQLADEIISCASP